jgi:lipooligosaccharide transport system permease protein
MKPELARLPNKRHGVYQIWWRNFLQFRKSWLVNIFWIVIEPLFMLVAIGYGVGAFIPSVDGYSYADFFFPALLCVSSMMVAFFVSTYDNFSKLTYQKTFATMILTPLDPEQIVIGELCWGATKGTFSAIGVSIVAFSFGHIDSWKILPALVVIFISSFLFSALGMLVTSLVKNYEGIIYPTSGLIVPMSLFAGTYFPLEQLPVWGRYLSYLLPLTHTTRAVRGLLLGGIPWWQILIHIVVLILIAAGLTKISIRRISQKLIY